MERIINKIKNWWHNCRNAKNNDKDNSMTNVVNSMFLCQPLYDKLKVKCHPDRFTNEEQKIEAENLFQLLQKYRYNLEKMKEIAPLIEDLYNRKL